jgi:hypothetical protein
VTRVYVPSTLPRLREAVHAGAVGPLPLLAHAVTDALRAEYAGAGEEEWEYAAMTAAAQDSVGLLTEEDPARRVVIALDAEAVLPAEGTAASLVVLPEPVALRSVAAVHVDDRDAEPAVAAARTVWAGARSGDPAATEVLERCLDHELGWFATQEIDRLLGP